MPLGTEVGLGQDDSVLDGDPSPKKGRTDPAIFGPCLLWPNGRPSQLLLSSCSQPQRLLVALSGFIVAAMGTAPGGRQSGWELTR